MNDFKHVWLDGWYSGYTPVYRFNFRTYIAGLTDSPGIAKRALINGSHVTALFSHQPLQSCSLYYEYDEQQQLNRIHTQVMMNLSEMKTKVIYERLDHQTRRFAN